MNLNKTTKTAIAAVSLLAELYEAEPGFVPADRIAAERDLKGPFVRKVLSELARAGIVQGSTGPGGGFRLARPPAEIRVAEVVTLFEPDDLEGRCPFGWGRCGVDRPCPLHNDYVDARMALKRFFESTDFGVFRDVAPGDGGS